MTQDGRRYELGNIEGFAIGDPIRSFRDRVVLDVRQAGDQSRAAFCWLFERDAGEIPDLRVNRFLEASFLHHPNLLRVFSAGASGGTIYAITEPFEATLVDQNLPCACNLEDLQRALLPVCAALSWLHSQDFVYCALSENFVVQCAGVWKLADFSELRIHGRTAPAETRRLLIRRDLYAPPEAYEGVVSPAWDAWSIGVLIERLWVRNARASGLNPRRSLPASLSDLIRELADPDPLQRPSLDDVANRLSQIRGREARSQSVPARDGPCAGAVPPSHQTSLVGSGAGKLQLPVRLHANDRIRIAAIVTLFVGAVTILAASYGRRVVENGKLTARTHVSSREYEPELQSQETRLSSAPQPNAFPAQTAAANLISGVDEKREISAFLDRWVESTRQRDVYRQSNSYAKVVRMYFGQRNVPVEAIRRAKEHEFARVQAGAEFSISDVRFERLNPDRAVISFRRTWDFPGRPFGASSREEMALNRINGVWKIASERELRAFVPRSAASRLPGPDTSEPDSILDYQSDGSIYGMAGNR